MEYNSWVEMNPLRRWRMKNHRRLSETAANVGVSGYTVYAWEWGLQLPNSGHMLTVEKLLGATIAQEWLDWWKKKPIKK